VAVEDLIFLSKILQTAKLVGVAVEPAALPNILNMAAQPGTQAAIFDLNHRSGQAVETLKSLKQNPGTKDVPVIGFLSHVQTDLAAAARAAGCDMLLARSAFTQQLAHLLEKYGDPTQQARSEGVNGSL
jgi:CheY-like chemotaxis protein